MLSVELSGSNQNPEFLYRLPRKRKKILNNTSRYTFVKVVMVMSQGLSLVPDTAETDSK